MQCFGSGPIWVFFKGSRSTAMRCVQFRPIKCTWKKKKLQFGGHFGGTMLSRKDEAPLLIFLSYQKIPEIIPPNLKNHFLVEFL